MRFSHEESLVRSLLQGGSLRRMLPWRAGAKPLGVVFHFFDECGDVCTYIVQLLGTIVNTIFEGIWAPAVCVATKTWSNSQVHKRHHLKRIVLTCSFAYLRICLLAKKITALLVGYTYHAIFCHVWTRGGLLCFTYRGGQQQQEGD